MVTNKLLTSVKLIATLLLLLFVSLPVGANIYGLLILWMGSLIVCS